MATTTPIATEHHRRWYQQPHGWMRVPYWIALVGLGVLFAYPFVWLLSASFKPRGEVFDNKIIPKSPTFDNFIKIWTEYPLVHWIFNSALVAVLAALAVAVSSALVAFGFAYFRFPFRNALFGLVLGTMMLPQAVTMIPVYLIWKDLGFLNTYVPLWAGNLFGSAFYIFLLRQFFLGLPRELYEAARVDGCNYFGLFRRICLPLSWPAMIIVFIFEIQASWNDLMQPLIYLTAGDNSKMTIPLGLIQVIAQNSPQGGGQGNFQWIVTAALLMTIPMIVVFACFQRYFIEGLATQGRKG